MLGGMTTTSPVYAAGPGPRRPEHAHSTNILLPCSSRGCLLDTASSPPPSPSPIPSPVDIDPRALAAFAEERTGGIGSKQLLITTGSAARWRRREGSVSNSQPQSRRLAAAPPRPTRPAYTRAATTTGTNIKDWSWLRPRDSDSKDLVLKVAVMEEVHGVDVSWLHRPKSREPIQRPPPSNPSGKKPDPPEKKQPSTNGNDEVPRLSKNSNNPLLSPGNKSLPSLPAVTTPTPTQSTQQDPLTALPSPSPAAGAKAVPKRPGLLSRTSSERVSNDTKSSSRRSSWMTSISSKLSSSPGQPGRQGATLPTQQLSKSPTTPPVTNSTSAEASEQAEPHNPVRPKESSSSFFSSLTRRLSSASQSGGAPRIQGTGGVCPRKVLNVDPNRERCLMPELEPSKLRRVSFCVDVEIVGGPRYAEEEDEEDRQRKKKEFKLKERAEGEALKHPEAIREEKDEEGEPKLEKEGKVEPVPAKAADTNKDAEAQPSNSLDDEIAARKREKKKKSEEERKERKEKKRRRAEESGSIPLEMPIDIPEDNGTSATKELGESTNPSSPPQSSQQPSRSSRNDRPTIDPARIYRRCCQLRESPILKRITEQLMNPRCMLPQEPGIVNCLDLTGSRLQVADFATLGDWLAVVPVKQLKLEDADLSDEGVRCVLAGLLSAKRPQPSARRSAVPRHREPLSIRPHQERAGVVEKLTLKNNPRITRAAWKHISLFLYMCRSLKSIDLSMNAFPASLPMNAPGTSSRPGRNGVKDRLEDLDAAEALNKCLSERPGGSKLEELIVSECSLNGPQIRHIVDGAVVAGISRLGLAGNNIDDEGLQHVTHYLRSGVCQGLDLGSNNLRGKLDVLAQAIIGNSDLPCWGLSLANCHLDSASLKGLFAALQKLPNFRFIDLGHNQDLCKDTGLITLLRRTLGSMKYLKRVHLNDVGMSPKQAIALADVLPEGPSLAHLNLLENPQLTALARAKTEADQGEACALYASLMAAARVSKTLICIDIDVPARDNSEVVKALAKQVVAYSLRNMEALALAEVAGTQVDTSNATAALTRPHGGADGFNKEVKVPDILLHLVGHIKYSSQNAGQDAPAPDDDYIVGGTGVVKALQYLIGEKANDLRRTSVPQTSPSVSGTASPRERPDSSAGLDEVSRGKAKQMSRDLLDDARKIRSRLQPALAKEAAGGDELAYRRLLFLDQTLQSMIGRFEEEYPETRVVATEGINAQAPTTNPASTGDVPLPPSTIALVAVNGGSVIDNASEDEDPYREEYTIHPEPALSRRNSNASLRVRSQNAEEGRLHRMGQAMRREMVDSGGVQSPASPPGTPFGEQPGSPATEADRLRVLGERLENISGVELRDLVTQGGMESALKVIGANYDDLRLLQEQDPENWENFVEAHFKSRANVDRLAQPTKVDTAESAVEV